LIYTAIILKPKVKNSNDDLQTRLFRGRGGGVVMHIFTLREVRLRCLRSVSQKIWKVLLTRGNQEALCVLLCTCTGESKPNLLHIYMCNCTPVHSIYKKSSIQCSAGIFITIYGGYNRVGIGLSYRPARLHRLAESIPLNRFLGSLKF
jgi:hypothetical protein